MACSCCGGTDHNIRSCPSVRRCSICNSPGHDRRRCPAAPGGKTIRFDDVPSAVRFLRSLAAKHEDALAHVYFPRNTNHFDANVGRTKPNWRFKATGGHGAKKTTSVRCINFFKLDSEFLEALEADDRGIRRLVMISRQEFDGHEGWRVVDVDRRDTPAELGHEGWRFDLHRPRIRLGKLGYCTVVRAAAPQAGTGFLSVPVLCAVRIVD